MQMMSSFLKSENLSNFVTLHDCLEDYMPGCLTVFCSLITKKKNNNNNKFKSLSKQNIWKITSGHLANSKLFSNSF